MVQLSALLCLVPLALEDADLQASCCRRPATAARVLLLLLLFRPLYTHWLRWSPFLSLKSPGIATPAPAYNSPILPRPAPPCPAGAGGAPLPASHHCRHGGASRGGRGGQQSNDHAGSAGTGKWLLVFVFVCGVLGLSKWLFVFVCGVLGQANTVGRCICTCPHSHANSQNLATCNAAHVPTTATTSCVAPSPR